MKFISFFLIAFALFVISKANIPELEGIEFLPNFLPKHAGDRYCATEDIWKWKKSVMAAKNKTLPQDCVTEGPCDTYQVRNQWLNRQMHIKLLITVICSSATSCPGNINAKAVEDQVAQINTDFFGTGVTFDYLEPNFVVDPQFAVISAYSPFSNTWYTQLTNLKIKYAQQPTTYLNVFITGQTSGIFGTLLGIGTFPWDPAAQTATGGLWVNANYVGGQFKTASHEIGHNVGLWHTFHGDSEVACTSDCYETVHDDFTDTSISNYVGDFCSDTPAQPMNYNCQFPTTNDCKGNPYTKFGNNEWIIRNVMGYTPDTCYWGFTKQQSMRAHCWVCSSLPGWVSDSTDCKL